MSPPAAAPADSQFRGIAMLLLAVALFSCLETCAKFLAGQYDTFQLVWMRYVVHFALAMLIIRPRPIWRPWISPRPWLQILRALALVAATGLNFAALRKLQMAEMVSIMFSAPLMTALLAVPVLGEVLGLRRLAAIGVGFAGVLVVVRPGFGGLSVEMLFCLAAAVSYTGYSLMTRVVAHGMPLEAAIIYPAVTGAVVLLPLMPVVWVTPHSATHWAVMFAAGCFGGLGHFILVFAYRHANAVVLQPFVYFQLVTTVTLGYIVIGDVPGLATAVGAVLIVGSGAYVAYREQMTRPRRVAPVRPDGKTS